MSIEEEFELQDKNFDVGSIKCDVELKTVEKYPKGNTILKFRFFDSKYQIFLVTFSYSHKKQKFSLITMLFNGVQLEQNIKASREIGDWYTKERFSMDGCFMFIRNMMEGIKDLLDPINLNKKLQLKDKLKGIDRDFR